ncbi:hypothetical protein ACWC3Y_10885 [Streptomyces sp. NPDC001296]
MTDTTRMLAWLRETLDTAEKRADRWHDVECLVHDISLADAVVLQGATLCVCDGPAAVLRRITADRKTLAEIARGVEYEAEPLADIVIRNLAEGYGWTEAS